MTSQPTKRQHYLLWAILISLLLLFIIQLPVLLDPYAVEEDFRTLVWVQRFQDPTLLSRTPFQKLNVRDVQIGPLTIILEEASPGYSLLAQAAGSIVSPSLFNKLLPFPLLLIGVYFIFRIGKKLTDDRMAFALSIVYTVLILASHTEISVIGGLHRSFVTPFLLALLYFILEAHYGGAAITLFLCGIIYLPIFPVSALTYFFSIVSFRENGRRSLSVKKRPFLYLLIAVLLVALTISPIISRQFNRAIGEESVTTTGAGENPPHMLADPTYRPGGRRPLFSLFPLVGRGGIVTGNSDSLHLLFMSILALAILLIRKKERQTLPPPFHNLFWASIVGFTMAWAGIIFTSSFLFYIPSRHTQSGFFLLLLIFIVINGEETLRIAFQWIRNNRRRLLWFMLPVGAIVILIALLPPTPEDADPYSLRSTPMRLTLIGLTAVLFLLAFINARRAKEESATRSPSRFSPKILGVILFLLSPLYIFLMQSLNNSFYFPTETEKELFTFVETLPKDALIGGNPCSLDNLPFYAKRSVLFSCERFRYLKDPQMVRDMLRAYYAESAKTTQQFCQEYEVDYLVVREETFTADFIKAGKLFYEPHNSWLLAQIAEQEQFALSQIPEEDKLFQHEGIFVIPCNAATLQSGS